MLYNSTEGSEWARLSMPGCSHTVYVVVRD